MEEFKEEILEILKLIKQLLTKGYDKAIQDLYTTIIRIMDILCVS